jgi:hypothetical protein
MHIVCRSDDIGNSCVGKGFCKSSTHLSKVMLFFNICVYEMSCLYVHQDCFILYSRNCANGKKLRNMEYFQMYLSSYSSPSESVTGKQPMNCLSLETTASVLDLHLHGTSQVCQELFVGDRRCINILGQLPNESFCNMFEFPGSRLLTTSDKPVRRPDPKNCLETCVNTLAGCSLDRLQKFYQLFQVNGKTQ